MTPVLILKIVGLTIFVVGLAIVSGQLRRSGHAVSGNTVFVIAVMYGVSSGPPYTGFVGYPILISVWIASLITLIAVFIRLYVKRQNSSQEES